MNINYFVGFLIVVAIYWITKNQYYKRLSTRCKFDLYKLRDELRGYAINGDINPDDWIFEYLDLSISKSITKIDNLNYWTILALYKKHRKQQRYINFNKKLLDALQKNDYAKKINYDYCFIVSKYISRKNFIIRYSMIIASLIARIFAKIINRFKILFERKSSQKLKNFDLWKSNSVKGLYGDYKEAACSISHLPETSAMSQFAI